MTIKYRAWLLLRGKPMTIGELAQQLGMPHKITANAVRSMIDCKQATPVVPAKRGRPATYRATDKAPSMQGRSANLRRRRSDDGPVVDGFGAGKIALEEAWRTRQA